MKLKWHQIGDNTYRFPIQHQGWLVKSFDEVEKFFELEELGEKGEPLFKTEITQHVSICFVPDPKHKWEPPEIKPQPLDDQE